MHLRFSQKDDFQNTTLLLLWLLFFSVKRFLQVHLHYKFKFNKRLIFNIVVNGKATDCKYHKNSFFVEQNGVTFAVLASCCSR